jgi:hypothetical protein
VEGYLWLVFVFLLEFLKLLLPFCLVLKMRVIEGVRALHLAHLQPLRLLKHPLLYGVLVYFLFLLLYFHYIDLLLINYSHITNEAL